MTTRQKQVWAIKREAVALAKQLHGSPFYALQRMSREPSLEGALVYANKGSFDGTIRVMHHMYCEIPFANTTVTFKE